MQNPIFITGGAGFIGSALIRLLIKESNYSIVNIDKLTYAANLSNLAEVSNNDRYFFERADICDKERIGALFKKYEPIGVIHLAAESHVDRSIESSAEFITTNILGTHTLLECARGYFDGLDDAKKSFFRFHHVSTDEVFGSLGDGGYFDENTPYDPRSPYSASKASSDHLVRAWGHTYGLPVALTNCSNNYGPYHFPEKLIPLLILNILEGKPLPIYGDGSNVRDWLYVEDHARALKLVFEKGEIGESYCIGGNNEKSNLEVATTLCDTIDKIFAQNKALKGEYPLSAPANNAPSSSLITFVPDRPGHDKRYAIDASKIRKELGFAPKTSFEEGILKTVEWYIKNKEWVDGIKTGAYRGWIEKNYKERQKA